MIRDKSGRASNFTEQLTFDKGRRQKDTAAGAQVVEINDILDGPNARFTEDSIGLRYQLEGPWILSTILAPWR